MEVSSIPQSKPFAGNSKHFQNRVEQAIMSSSYETNAVQKRNYTHTEHHGLNPETKRHRVPPILVIRVEYHI